MKSGVYQVLCAGLSHSDILEHLDLHRLKCLSQIQSCHEGSFGAVEQRCDECGKKSLIAMSCRNRSCPRCQINASLHWLCSQHENLLNTRYFHNVFTVPHCLNPVIRQNLSPCMGALFDAVAKTLQCFAHNTLGANIGITSVLHSWGQQLNEHYHLHCIVSAGGIALDGSRWVQIQDKRLFNVKALSLVYQAKYLSALERLYKLNKLEFHGNAHEFETPQAFKDLLKRAARKKWVVYSKQPFAGPGQVLRYLSLYTHRTGIADQRILKIDQDKQRTLIAYKDYADADAQKNKRCWLSTREFVRRFCLHILPRGFVKIRHYGFLSNRNRRENLQQARELISRLSPIPIKPTHTQEPITETLPEIKVPCCPWCGSPSLHFERKNYGLSVLPKVMYLPAPDTS